jgi:RimJ/RimL family protein N-acetyltransferase
MDKKSTEEKDAMQGKPDEAQRRVIFLQGKKTVLRPLRKDTDLESCLVWLNDPEVNWYIRRFLPLSLQEEEAWFEDLPRRPNDIVLAIETIEGQFIGVTLLRINWKDRVAATGTLIGEKKFWDEGYGTDAKMILLNYAFNTLNLRKICSVVYEFNKRSLRYSKKCGYRIEGKRQKQVFKKGKYWDEIIMGVFKEEWLVRWRKYWGTSS